MKLPLIVAVSFSVLTGCSAMSGSNFAENGSWAELGAHEGMMGSRERQNQFEVLPAVILPLIRLHIKKLAEITTSIRPSIVLIAAATKTKSLLLK